jgi:hypothetical protein
MNTPSTPSQLALGQMTPDQVTSLASAAKYLSMVAAQMDPKPIQSAVEAIQSAIAKSQFRQQQESDASHNSVLGISICTVSPR